VLSKDENTGGSDLEFDPKNPDIVYACLWEQRQGRGRTARGPAPTAASSSRPTAARPGAADARLPAEGVVQADIAIAPSDANRIYATVANRSASASTDRTTPARTGRRSPRTPSRRPHRRRRSAGAVVDPKNADIVIMASTVSWKIDGRRQTLGWRFRGAPGGDDYQRAWISPVDSNIIAMASDQGAIVSVNGGETWSSWYNQPTSQMYHVNAGQRVPVSRVRRTAGERIGVRREPRQRRDDHVPRMASGRRRGVRLRRARSARPDIIYGGKVTRYNRRTGQVQNIAPTPVRPADFRTLRTAPVVFSTVDPHVMFFASNTLWKTATGGRSWQQISTDLTRKTWSRRRRSANTAAPTRPDRRSAA
jgi:hypothetical protein